MRAIDLDFIQETIKKMPLTEEGRFRTIMYSEDYCKRALVSGLSSFAITETPQSSALILTDSSSYYHCRIYNESLKHYQFIAILSANVNEVNILLSKLANETIPVILHESMYNHPLLVKPHNFCTDTISNGNIRALTRLWVLALTYKSETINLIWNNNQDIELETMLKYNGFTQKIINLADQYELPITSISTETPGIQL